MNTKPASILQTHLHLDHAGSVRALAQLWEVPVYAHPGELLTAEENLACYPNPLDRWLMRPMLRVMPPQMRTRMLAESSERDYVRGLDPAAPVPGLPEWECIATPGHTPGHVAFYRRNDGVLITGDAVVTMELNSVRNLGRHRVCGPPRITTWSWPVATDSIAALAALEPRVLATGHGRPVVTGAAQALQALSHQLTATTDRSPSERRMTEVLRGVNYSRRTRYRRPPGAYLRLQWLGPRLTALGIRPDYVVTLEVPGRKSGVIRRTTLVQVTYDDEHYLVALAGESEWVRNVRAAGGRVVVGREQRHAATLVEVPPEDRAPIILAYLLRAAVAPVPSRLPTRPAVSSG